MKTFMQFLKEKVDLKSNDSQKILLEMLATLFAARWVHHNSHWKEKGENFYGNHLLFQRIYESIDAEIDGLAEKIVAFFGEKAINQLDVIKNASQWVEKWNLESTFKNSIAAEQDLQRIFQQAYNSLKENKDVSLGLDDFIMATANAHETNLYLLQQANS